MMELIPKKINFYKYQGTGNDFIIINQLDDEYDLSAEKIREICDRRFGVGGDGLMYLRSHPTADFQMVYFNSDGNQSTMCGNGGRCISHLYIKHADIPVGQMISFEAIDGTHQARLVSPGIISLQMGEVVSIHASGEDFIIDTGSPHFVTMVNDVSVTKVIQLGKTIRNSIPFKENGINVNFLQQENGFIRVRTYERGVEDETLSCGTGVTACALVAHVINGQLYKSPVKVHTLGGELNVSFARQGEGFSNVWLTGPAVQVFSGVWQTELS